MQHEHKKKRFRKRFISFVWRSKKVENTSKLEENIQKALIGELARNKYQPRSIFDETKIDELSNQ